jgi:hypothetical protein
MIDLNPNMIRPAIAIVLLALAFGGWFRTQRGEKS